MLTENEDLTWVVEEFCNDHATLDVGTFRSWCDATGNEAYKKDVPDNQTLRRLIANSAFAARASEVPA